MDNSMGIDYLFDGRKDREPEPMSNEERVRFEFITEKEITIFIPMTEKKGVSDCLTMRQFNVGGSTIARILGEALPNLDQNNYACELEDLLGLGVRDDGGIN